MSLEGGSGLLVIPLIILPIDDYWQTYYIFRNCGLPSVLNAVDRSQYPVSQPTNNGRSQEYNAARGGFVDILRLITAVSIRLVTNGCKSVNEYLDSSLAVYLAIDVINSIRQFALPLVWCLTEFAGHTANGCLLVFG